MNAGSRCMPPIMISSAIALSSFESSMLTMLKIKVINDRKTHPSAVVCFSYVPFRHYHPNVNHIFARHFSSNWPHLRPYGGSVILMSIDKKDLNRPNEHDEAASSLCQSSEPEKSILSRQVASEWRNASLIDAG